MNYSFLINSFKDYKEVFDLLNQHKPEVVLLSGGLGAGKTSFVGAYLSSVYGENEVKAQGFMSPTFNIINQYELKAKTYSHVDLYRLSDSDIEDLALEDVLSESKIVFIEWYGINKSISESLSKKNVFVEIKKKASSEDSKNERREITLDFKFS